jgi:CCR4-NOT transcription complex subunit 7/8
LLTGRVYFAMREKIYNGDISDDHIGKIWGLGFPETYGFTVGPALDGTPPGLQGQNGGGGGTGAASGQQNGGAPSTPNTGSVGLVTTPAAQSHNTNSVGGGGSGGAVGMGPLTPGAGVGAFGNFAFPGANRS